MAYTRGLSWPAAGFAEPADSWQRVDTFVAGLSRLITVLEERRNDTALDYLSDAVVEIMES